jgi:hypothetical protein
MIDATVYYQSHQAHRRRLPTVPAIDSFIEHDGHLWRVSAVVYGTPSTTWGGCPVHVYANQVSDQRGKELKRQWDTWATNPPITPTQPP